MFVLCVCSVGTPFQFQLPQSTLKPVVSITPPPEDINHTSSTTTMALSEDEDTPAAVSPSEMDFFSAAQPLLPFPSRITKLLSPGSVSRPPATPPLLEEDHENSQSALHVEAPATPPLLEQDHETSPSPQSQESRGRVEPPATPPLPEQDHVTSESPKTRERVEPRKTPLSNPKPPGAKNSHTPSSSSGKKSPHLSLSLKKSCVARWPLHIPGASVNSAGGFEMGVASHQGEQDSMLSYGLTPSPPPIDVPSDSQFEASESTEVFFKITKPPRNQSRASEAEEMDAEQVPEPTSENSPLDKSPTDKAGEIEGPTAEPRPVPVSRREEPGKRSPEKSPVVDEDMEVENMLRAKTKETPSNPILEKQNACAAERTGLSINLTTSCSSVPSSTATSRSSLIPSVTSQSPVRPLASPVFNPLHSRAPPGYHHPHSPVSALASSEFVSPSRSISAEGLQELRRQVAEQLGKEAEVYELRYVRTVCTVIEERVISSEPVENGVVVSGSGKCWPVSKHDGWVGEGGMGWEG